jgi:serine protease Do/serine protease DegQ
MALPIRFRGGVVVTAVAPGSRAESMGLATGDVLLEVDRKPIGSTADFRRKTRRLGRAVIVLIYRGDTTLYLAARRR